MSDLRKRLIRLAYTKPELREDLLPLLKTAMTSKERKRLDVLQKKEDSDSLTKSENKEYEALVEKYRMTKAAGNRPTRLKSIRQIQKLTGPITMVQSESSTSPQGDFWFTDGYDALYAYAPKNSREFETMIQMFSD